MNFVEMITLEYEAKRAQRAAKEETTHREDEAKIREDLDDLGVTEKFTIENHIVTFDRDLILQAVYDYNNYEYQVQGVCDKCFQTCWSTSSRTLAYIGEMYHDFKASYKHRCPTKSTASSLEEKLIETLKDLVASKIEEFYG